MIALARIERGRLIPERRHAPREEYFSWVRGVLPNPAGVKMRRYFYNRFVSRWPNPGRPVRRAPSGPTGSARTECPRDRQANRSVP